MNHNHFVINNLKKRLVERSAKPRYNGKFALSTDVNLIRQYDTFTETMVRAAATMDDPFFIHFKTETDTPRDMIRLVPSILQSFNRTRTLRRARISGLRMCNLFTDSGDWYYVSDMVVACAFDALAITAALADYAHVGSFIRVRYNVPAKYKGRGVHGLRDYAAYLIDRFWFKTKLSRHSVAIHFDENHSTPEYIYLEFEPKSLSHISLLSYLLGGFSSDILSTNLLAVEVGRNYRLVITRRPLWYKGDYLVYSPDKALNNYRYHHCAGFGFYYNNPDFPIY